MAEGCLDSARRASESSGPWSEEAVYQNLSYALELGLKAFVRANGWSDDRCHREIRHDLVKAWRAAEEAGLSPLDAEMARLLVVLTPFYATHSIAELVRGGSRGLEPSRILPLTAGVLSRIRAAIDRRHGRQVRCHQPDPRKLLTPERSVK